MQPLELLVRRPADPSLARLGLERRALPSDQAQPPPVAPVDADVAKTAPGDKILSLSTILIVTRFTSSEKRALAGNR